MEVEAGDCSLKDGITGVRMPVSIFGVVSQEGEETREDNVDAVVGESRGFEFRDVVGVGGE
jgi:hypothetical protein